MQTFLRVSIVLCATVCGCFLQAGETRTWTDSSGKFKVEAELVRVEDDKAVIKKTDGKVLTIPLSKLSEEDRKYVEESKENPFAGGDEEKNPFAEGGDAPAASQRSTRSDRSAASERFSSRKREIENRARSSRSGRSPARGKAAAKGPEDFSDFGGNVFDTDPKPVSLRRGIEGGAGGAGTSWSCEADPSKERNLEEAPRNLSFAVGELPFAVHPKDAGLAVYSAQDKPRVLAAMNLDMENKGNSMTLVFFGDPVSGRGETLRFDPKVILLGVSPDGSKALFREEPWGFGTQKGKMNFIHIVKIDGTKLSPLAAYEPFSDDSEPNSMHNWNIDVEDGQWIDDEHVMLCSSKRLIVLNVDSGQVAWKMSVRGGRNKFVFSPGRKYCILPNSSGATLVDSVTGRTIGQLDGTAGRSLSTSFAFSPDGTKIAAAGNDGVTLWNATDGQAEETFYVGSMKPSAGTYWTDNQFLLVGGTLVDTKTKSLAWNYTIPGESCFYGGYLWFVPHSGRDDLQIAAAKIPHAKALLASTAPESKRFCVRPGLDVWLDIDGSVRNGRDKIQGKMLEIIEENELVLKPDAAVILLLTVVEEEEKTTHYTVGRGLGSPAPIGRGGGTEVKYRPCKFTIEFVQGSKTLWSLSTTTRSPNNIPLDDIQNDSLQSIVDKAMVKANAEYDKWFSNAKIPKRIPGADGCGKSTLSATGIQDTN